MKTEQRNKFYLDGIAGLRTILEFNGDQLLKEALWFSKTNTTFLKIMAFGDNQYGSFKLENFNKAILSKDYGLVEHLIEYFLEGLEDEFI